ncbi:MAG: alkaline phosphatase, partial [Deferrisomatales bacterium]
MRVSRTLVAVTAALGAVSLAAGPALAKPKQALARNVIVMISDGMGYNHLAAGDLYEAGKLGVQPFEKFPFRFGMSTHPGSTSSTPDCGAADPGPYDPEAAWTDFDYVKANATDSAAAATTMATGVKTYNNAIGKDLCGNDLENAVEKAEALGKATGVVSSVQFSHATPAGFVAHNVSRNDYVGIGREMLLESAADVILGAGHPWFDNSGRPKASPDYPYVGGQVTWDAVVTGT